MKIKLVAFYKGIHFAINPFKFCVRQRKAFRPDIFFIFDPGNDLLTINLHVQSFWKLVQSTRTLWKPHYRHRNLKKIGPWNPEISFFRFTVGGHLGFWPKKIVKGVEKIEPHDFRIIWSLMMQYPSLTQFRQTNLANSIFVTSQPSLLCLISCCIVIIPCRRFFSPECGVLNVRIMQGIHYTGIDAHDVHLGLAYMRSPP